MTTSNTNNRGGPYAGDSVTVAYTVPFYFLLNTEITVTRLNADLTTTTLVLNTDYTVTGAGVNAGGTVTLTAGSVAPVGSTVTITPNPSLVQNQSYPTTGTFPSKAAEQGYDRLTIIANFLLEKINRAAKLSLSTAVNLVTGLTFADPVPGAYLAYDATGTLIIAGASSATIAAAAGNAAAAAASAVTAQNAATTAQLYGGVDNMLYATYCGGL